MPDVLETLRKLPKVCAVWLEGENKGALIKRGVLGFIDFPLATKAMVEAFNVYRAIDGDQLAAMVAGATLGWDSEAADLKREKNVYIYEVPFRLMMSVEEYSEEDAAKLAEATISRVSQWLSTQDLGDNVLCLARDLDEVQLVDEKKA